MLKQFDDLLVKVTRQSWMLLEFHGHRLACRHQDMKRANWSWLRQAPLGPPAIGEAGST